MVNCGGFVVKTWLETTANSTAKISSFLRFIFGAMRLEKGMGREADFSDALLTVKL